MKLFRLISSFLMTVALAVLLVPEVLQVSLHDHEHTEDVKRTCCDFHFENLHKHCLEIDFYVTNVYFIGTTSIEFTHTTFEKEQFFLNSLVWVYHIPQSLRGPPALLS